MPHGGGTVVNARYKSSRHPSRVFVSCVGGILLSLAGVISLTGSASAQSSAVSTASPASTVPTPPPPGSSMAVWQAWAAHQRSVFQQTDWSRSFSSSGCTSGSITINPVTSEGAAGVPKGIVTDAVSIPFRCSGGTSPSSGLNKTVQPSTSMQSSDYCPAMGSYTLGAVNDGYACVGTYGSNDMAAAYTYTLASGSTYGHVELGQVSGSCGPGTLVANFSPEETLKPGYGQEVVWGPMSASADWSSTWWQDDGGGTFTDFGSVCGFY